MENSSSLKRESLAGRWLPVLFYSANIVTWLVIGIAAGNWDLMVLIFFPLPALILYVIRTQRKIK